MNSRERVARALAHLEPDKLPLDLGGAPTTGMHASSVYLLRQALSLDSPGTPVRVVEPYQILGEIKGDLMDRLGVDVVQLPSPRTMFGFRNEGWKPWQLFDGTPVLVPESFNTEPEPNGDILMYPEGDRTAPPSGRMPRGGFYFDTIVRQESLDEDRLDPADNLEEYSPISGEDLHYFEQEALRLYEQTDKAIVANFGGMALGDISLVPAPQLKHPRGIRDIAEWYMSTVSRRDYVHRVFERQCEIALGNLERLFLVVGNRITAVYVSGTDFGMQTGPLVSPKAFRELYMPFYRQINDWIHTNTEWKSFMHSCGGIFPLIPSIIEAGFDILNPVQTSAAGMDPRVLKRQFGSAITFWGGGVDTQKVLPFGRPDEVREQVKERIHTFGPGGGFVFNTIHNLQAGTPIENMLALYEAFEEFRDYPGCAE